MNKPYEIKWQPAHFPAGTIFQLKDERFFDYLRAVSPMLQFEVKEVRNNGLKSYIIETTKRHEEVDDKGKPIFRDMNYSMNLDHVAAIIKRGDGPTLVRYEEPGCDPSTVSRLMRDFQQQKWPEVKGRFKAPRSHYWFTTPHLLIRYLAIKYMRPGAYCLDVRKAALALETQPFVHSMFRWVSAAPKKRVDAWFKANCNRFLVNLEKEVKRQEEDDARECEADWDCEHPQLDVDDDSELLDSGNHPMMPESTVHTADIVNSPDVAAAAIAAQNAEPATSAYDRVSDDSHASEQLMDNVRIQGGGGVDAVVQPFDQDATTRYLIRDRSGVDWSLVFHMSKNRKDDLL